RGPWSPACAPRLDSPMPTEGMASPGSQPGLTSTVGAPHRLVIGVVAALAATPALPRRRGRGKGARRKLKAGKLKVGRSRGRGGWFEPMARGARSARLRFLLPPPPAGEGWGGGPPERRSRRARRTRSRSLSPPAAGSSAARTPPDPPAARPPPAAPAPAAA